ncbi:uncharacterized protein LOC118418848 [Branchiostoma floridae]|uniref:Uncharacterized protein LOC118418848 n=1 Tax=Branchiostoma floridae TaxID=7739 RepID=A0A9J7LEX1_BRAFL|nr:uncharacterized protein LOC118418848 [Branchiostoma floridae]XP_035680830.1 uncharacterized protein LOC118418848 [Branchiostoma floridae]XP_035680831.1 uncharacterized protein LOC118418848 [Branchiostoma floridae]
MCDSATATFAGIPCLPSEVQGEILYRLHDGVALTNARQVCRLWKQLVDQPGDKQVWYTICRHTIPNGVLQHMTQFDRDTFFQTSSNKVAKSSWSCGKKHQLEQRISLSSQDRRHSQNTIPDCIVHKDINCQCNSQIQPCVSDPVVYWRSVYMEWYRGRFAGKWAMVKTQYNQTFGPLINSIAISGDYILTGMGNGSILQWEAITGRLMGKCHANVGGAVMALHWRGGYNSRYNASSQSQCLHDFVVTGGRDGLVYVLPLPLTQAAAAPDQPAHRMHMHMPLVGSAVNCISVWQDRVIVAGAAGDLCVLYFSRNSAGVISPHFCPTHHYRLQGAHFKTVKSVVQTQDKALSYSDSKLLLWCLLTRQCLREVRRGEWVVGMVPHGNAALLLSSGVGPVTEVDLDSWVEVDVLEREEQVTPWSCIAAHGDLIAVGTNSGQVTLYHTVTKSRTILRVSDAPITALDIGDDGEGPVVAIVTNTSPAVWVYHWFPPDDEDT